MNTQEAEYSIRLAHADELEELNEIECAGAQLFAEIGLHQVAASDPLPLDFLQEQQRAGLVWVAAEANGDAVGFAVMSELGDVIYLEEISVHPAHGRRGLGRLLIETLCDWADANGFEAVTLSTFQDVPWNAPFYSRIGFRALDITGQPPALKNWLEEELACWAPLKRVYMRRDL